MGTREKWLLSLLTAVFVTQAGTLLYGISACSKLDTKDIPLVCPKLGERFDTTFSTMIATTLALLTGSAVASAATKPRSKTTTPPPGRQ